MHRTNTLWNLLPSVMSLALGFVLTFRLHFERFMARERKPRLTSYARRHRDS